MGVNCSKNSSVVHSEQKERTVVVTGKKENGQTVKDEQKTTRKVEDQKENKENTDSSSISGSDINGHGSPKKVNSVKKSNLSPKTRKYSPSENPSASGSDTEVEEVEEEVVNVYDSLTRKEAQKRQIVMDFPKSLLSDGPYVSMSSEETNSVENHMSAGMENQAYNVNGQVAPDDDYTDFEGSEKPRQNQVAPEVTETIENEDSVDVLREHDEQVRAISIEEDKGNSAVPNADGKERSSSLKKDDAIPEELVETTALPSDGEFRNIPIDISQKIISYLQIDIPEEFLRSSSLSMLCKMLFGYSQVPPREDIRLIVSSVRITGSIDQDLMMHSKLLFNLVRSVKSLQVDKITNVEEENQAQAFMLFQNVLQLERLSLAMDGDKPDKCMVMDSGIDYIETCCNLRSLVLYNLGHVSLYIIINMAKHMPRLEKLVVERIEEEQREDKDDTKSMLNADFGSLQYCKKLRHLEIDNFRIVGAEFATELDTPFRYCPLRTIGLRRAGIEKEGELPPLHLAINTLRRVDLSGNALDKDVVKQVVMLPGGNLQHITLKDNTSTSAAEILSLIVNNENHSSLQRLRVLEVSAIDNEKAISAFHQAMPNVQLC